MYLKASKVSKLIERTRGRIFKVVFVKRTNGQLRTMIARIGVHRYVTGGGLAYDPSSHALRSVYDIQGRGYKMVSLDSCIEFKCGRVHEYAGRVRQHLFPFANSRKKVCK